MIRNKIRVFTVRITMHKRAQFWVISTPSLWENLSSLHLKSCDSNSLIIEASTLNEMRVCETSRLRKIKWASVSLFVKQKSKIDYALRVKRKVQISLNELGNNIWPCAWMNLRRRRGT